jgi:transposase
VHLQVKREDLCCAKCQSKNVRILEWKERSWKTIPVGNRPVFLVMRCPKVECQSCFARSWIRVAFAEQHKRHTRAFEKFVCELLSFATVQDIARMLDVSWHTINEIQKRRLQKHFGKITNARLRKLRHLGIDEIYLGKKHRFVTLVLDMDTREVVFVAKGKGSASVAPFFKRLRRIKAKIKAVASDLSRAYIKAVTEFLGHKVKLILDRFHIVKLLNDKLTKLRRELYNEATDKLQKQVLKGSRYLLLKNPENLEDMKDERDRLDQALWLNESLNKAYYLKEELRQLWSQSGKRSAGKFLSSWCTRAESTGIRVLQQMSKTLRGYRTAVLNWYDHPLSNGPLEGINNKIKLMQRKAYGYRDIEMLKLRIYSLHKTKTELIG